MFSNDHRVLSQGNTRLRLLYLLNIRLNGNKIMLQVLVNSVFGRSSIADPLLRTYNNKQQQILEERDYKAPDTSLK